MLAESNYNRWWLAKTNLRGAAARRRVLRKEEGIRMMPLTLADFGESYIIKKIGGSPEIKKHLEDLGFVVGGSVTIVSSLGGNVIVKVKESRIAINDEMARRIMI